MRMRIEPFPIGDTLYITLGEYLAIREIVSEKDYSRNTQEIIEQFIGEDLE